MSASDTSHIPMLMTEGQGYLDTYVCCQEPHQDVDQWCFTFKQYEIDNADNDQCQKTNGWTATKLNLVALLISLLSRSSCSDQMNYGCAAHGCDEDGNWVMFDVQAELAELQRKLDLLWTSELLNFWTPPSRLFIPPAHFWIAPQNCSAILWFCLSTVLRVYLMLYPHSHKSYNATCEPSMHKNAPPCDFLSCLNNPMLWWKWL